MDNESANLPWISSDDEWHNEAKWSSRYYRTDCPDIIVTMKTDGPDYRLDPGPDATLGCIIKEHGEHALLRISPKEWEILTEEEFYDEDDED